MQRWQALLERLRTFVGRFTRRQLFTMVAAFGLTAGGLTWIVVTAAQTPHRVLFRDLPAEQLAAVVEALEAEGIDYRLEGASTLSVPEDRLHEARISLAGRGLPDFEGAGFELFDEADFGMTTFTQRVNYQRAMENELSRTIRHLAGVRSARVHLVLPEETLFREDQEEPSASVVLDSEMGLTPDSDQIRAIRHLVASAVEGLRPGQVNIVDNSGRMLARASDGSGLADAGEALSVGSNLEHEMSARIVQLLAPIVGRESVRANVRVELDTAEVVETTENYDPQVTAIRAEQRSEETSSRTDADVAGVPGVVANLPGGAGAGGDGALSQSSRAEEQVNYEINSTVRQRTQLGYQIERLTVAVIVDEAALVASETVANGTGDSAAPPLDRAARLAGLTELVQNTVGYDPARGDRVVVSAEAFVSVAPGAEGGGGFWSSPGFWFTSLRYLVLLAVALLLGLFVLRPAVRSLTATTEEPPEVDVIVRTVGELTGDEAEAALARLGVEEQPEAKVQEQLRDEVIQLSHSDIDRTSEVIREWIRLGRP